MFRTREVNIKSICPKKYIKIVGCHLLLVCFNSYAQTIINTENMMSGIDNNFAYTMSFQGDFNFGNIDLLQLSTAHQFSKKINRSTLRLLANYDYIKESEQIIASDFTGQLRYNYQIKENSIFGFIQGQSVRSLKMKHRYIGGGGYRHQLYSKKENYLDMSGGIFFEDELYDETDTQQLQIYNWRLSFSAFGKYNFTDKLFLNISIYHQINISNFKDYRLFIQPRLYYSLNKIDLFLDSTYRFHSTPYVDVQTTDSSLTFGLELSL